MTRRYKLIAPAAVSAFIAMLVLATAAWCQFNPNQGTVKSVGVNNATGNTLFQLGIINANTTPVLSAVMQTQNPYTVYGVFGPTSAVPTFGIPPMLAGGTGAGLTPTSGALVYSNASNMALLGTGLRYQILTQGTTNPVYANGLMGFSALTGTTVLTSVSPSYYTVAPGSSPATITLPQASAVGGKVVLFEQISGSGVVTVAAASGDTIEGNASIGLVTGVSVAYISDGAGVWRAAGGGTTFNLLANTLGTPAIGNLIVGTSSSGYGVLAQGANNQIIGVSNAGALGYLNGLIGFQALSTSTTLTANSPSYSTIASGSTTVNITLPAASSCAGKVVILEQISGSGVVSINRAGSDLIESSTTISPLNIGTPYGYISDGVSTWRAISSAGSTFNQLAPATTIGGLIVGTGVNTYGNLAGNASTTRKFPVQVGNGTSVTSTIWDTIKVSDVPGVGLANGGTQTANFTAAISTNYQVSLASSNVTATLPDATLNAGQNIELGVSAIATGNPYGLGFATTSSQTIDGLSASAYPGINELFGKIVFRSEGGNWVVVSQ